MILSEFIQIYWVPFNKKEMVFLFFPFCFHILFWRKNRWLHQKSLKGIGSFVDF